MIGCVIDNYYRDERSQYHYDVEFNYSNWSKITLTIHGQIY